MLGPHPRPDHHSLSRGFTASPKGSRPQDSSSCLRPHSLHIRGLTGASQDTALYPSVHCSVLRRRRLNSCSGGREGFYGRNERLDKQRGRSAHQLKTLLLERPIASRPPPSSTPQPPRTGSLYCSFEICISNPFMGSQGESRQSTGISAVRRGVHCPKPETVKPRESLPPNRAEGLRTLFAGFPPRSPSAPRP